MSIINQSLISTNANTNPDKKPPIIDKNYFTHKENIENHIKGVYPMFYEQFELNKFLNAGSEGFVYEGRYKQGSNNQKYAFKFCIKGDEKKRSKKRFKK